MSDPEIPENSTPRPRRWLLGALAASIAVVFVSGAAMLTSPGLAGAHRAMFRHGGGHGPEALRTHVALAADYALYRVEATSEQKARVQEILDRALDDLEALHPPRRELHDQVVAALTAPEVDRAALEALRAKHLAAFDAASRRIVVALGDLGDVLTAEQRVELAELARSFHGQRHD
jgi:Spy/CpxP family protein refolding chaperone